ncbi:ABC transporter permease [Virgibacillus litoralis]|uniref:ABC-2 type transport system permease protein n=1 Tax=Virgibacillus litoralis TaxID=578221 RepID=A0ABS4H9Z9_9BACI|nr:ABC transporter permease [Virgibacillus litoralis]MBP1947735.1 ABC-2 type transport system permease protein [Virgibacillus litoralis]
MKSILATRFIHWKKQRTSLIFWLLFPIIATIGIITATEVLQEDTKVPVGVVLEEETEESKELVEEIKTTPFVRIREIPEDDALHQLRKHELDSVFVIHEGFEEKILENNRSQLITSYQSDLSFAYSPVKEIILSYVQQETGKSKAAFTVKELEQQYETNTGWTFEEIVIKSNQIEQDENLLNTAFSFSGSPVKGSKNTPLFSIWGLWAICSMLSTLLLFDWVIKERQSNTRVRFAFTRWTLKSYLLQNLILYSVLFFIIDLLTVITLYAIFGEWINIFNLIVFRILLSLAAFLLAHLFKTTYLFYSVSFGLTLFVTISSGAVLPPGVTDWFWLDLLNPVLPLLSGEYLSLWSLIVILFTIVWLVRKERYHA